MFQEIIYLKPNSNKIISFVKFISTDVGNFYSLNIQLVKSDMAQQGSNLNYRPGTSPSTSDMDRPSSNIKA